MYDVDLFTIMSIVYEEFSCLCFPNHVTTVESLCYVTFNT